MRNRNKDPRRIKPRRFRCPVCGVTVDMPKYRRKRTEPGHIKTAWCYVCREIRDFVQLDENRPEGAWRDEAEQAAQTETAQNS